MNQRGFATLEVILMIVVIGILATVAVPRFTDVTTKANTAKIQSDLTTIDTAIQIYYMEKGEYPADIKALVDGNYLMDTPTPPTGYAYVKTTENSTTTAKETKINGPNYGFTETGDTNKVKRASLDGNTVDKFTLPK